MVKIIKHGPKHLKARCSNCGCIFKYDLDDVTFIEKNGVTSYNVVKCPDCGEAVHRQYFE